MKRDDIGAGFAELFDVSFRLDDHQMTVKNQLRAFAQIPDDLRTPSNIRDEAAVHDVQMDVCRTVALDFADLFGYASEVGRKDRRRDLNGHTTWASFTCAAAAAPRASSMSMPLKFGTLIEVNPPLLINSETCVPSATPTAGAGYCEIT